MKYSVTGQIPSGIAILTYFNDLESYKLDGMLLSWVQQASLDPVMISMAIEKGRLSLEKAKPEAVISLHFLSQSNKSVFVESVKNFPKVLQGFSVSKHIRYDVPVLEGLNALVIKVSHHFDVGSHILVCGKVLDEVVATPEKPWVHIRNSALNY
jgi:flavin reductase (DIM6/NTAB) family NADH-FMN oxidoreductase RutF